MWRRAVSCKVWLQSHVARYNGIAMNYIRRVLQPNENLVYVTQLHWLVYARGFVLLALAVVVAAAAETQVSPDLRPIALYAALGFLILGTVAIVLAAIRRASTELAVTDHRVIFKRGVVGRYTIEMARSKVESVDVVQTLMGRIFNYGTILVRGTGGTLEPFRNIENPLQLRSAITAQ